MDMTTACTGYRSTRRWKQRMQSGQHRCLDVRRLLKKQGSEDLIPLLFILSNESAVFTSHSITYRSHGAVSNGCCVCRVWKVFPNLPN
jgi:hypothetical protein